MTIVDEAMARLRRDRPEMSRESLGYVQELLNDTVAAAERALLAALRKHEQPAPKPPSLDPRSYGWAPGDYLGICTTCREQHISAKRSLVCHGCAVKARDEAVALWAAPTAPSAPAGSTVPSDP